jgi:phospholipid:diacylglycerol acyltransferase
MVPFFDIHLNNYLKLKDWRLGFEQLELRDNYFTKLKYKIESFKKIHNKKSILICHSFGSLIAYYFFNWVFYSNYKFI